MIYMCDMTSRETVAFDTRDTDLDNILTQLGWGQAWGEMWSLIRYPKAHRHRVYYRTQSLLMAADRGAELERVFKQVKAKAWKARKELLLHFKEVMVPNLPEWQRRRYVGAEGRPKVRAWRELRQIWVERARQERQDREDMTKWGRVLGPDETPF